jgi:hypothetical protein
MVYELNFLLDEMPHKVPTANAICWAKQAGNLWNSRWFASRMIDSHIIGKKYFWEWTIFHFLQTKHETNEFGPEAISKWPTNDLAFRAIRKKKPPLLGHFFSLIRSLVKLLLEEITFQRIHLHLTDTCNFLNIFQLSQRIFFWKCPTHLRCCRNSPSLSIVPENKIFHAHTL